MLEPGIEVIVRSLSDTLVLMKNFVDDLPNAINLHKGEQICESMASPVLYLKSNSRDRFNDLDVFDSCLNIDCRPIGIIPVK